RQYGTLDAALAEGRFAAQADELRIYKRMATLDADAPLPPFDDQTPAWADASAFARELGMNALADRPGVLASTQYTSVCIQAAGSRPPPLRRASPRTSRALAT